MIRTMIPSIVEFDIAVAISVLSHTGESARAGKVIVFHRKGWMRLGDATTSVRTMAVSEQIVELTMDVPARIGLACALHFRTVVGNRITTLHLTGSIAYCTLVGLNGYRVGVRMDRANRENGEQLAAILSSRA